MANSDPEVFVLLIKQLGDRPKSDPAAQAVLSLLSEMERKGRFSQDEAKNVLSQMIGATYLVESEKALYVSWGREAARMDIRNRPLWFVVTAFSERLNTPQFSYIAALMARIRAVATELLDALD